MKHIPGLNETENRRDKIFNISLLVLFPSSLFLLYVIDKIVSFVTYRHILFIFKVGTDSNHHFLLPPLMWIKWQLSYYSYDGLWFQKLDKILFYCFIFLTSISILLYSYFLQRKRAQPAYGLHGTAYFAKDLDNLNKTGLLNPKYDTSSVVVGGWTDKTGKLHFLRHKGPEHILAIAPTRSGKGVGLVVPTLLTWGSSCIIHDIKGELWAMTSGWRRHHAKNDVLKFDPAALDGSCSYNVLSEIRLESEYAVSDVQNIVTILVDPQGQGLESDHWAGSAHSLLSGVILFTLYSHQYAGKPTPSLYDIGYQLADPTREEGTELWEEMKIFTLAPSLTANEIVQQTGADLLQTHETGPEEYASIISTSKRFLNLYRDPIVKKNTSISDFSVLDLVNSQKPVSLYLVIRLQIKIACVLSYVY